MSKFLVERDGDEDIKFYVDGEVVAEADHDNHGWAGIELAEHMFLNVANALGIKVEFTDVE